MPLLSIESVSITTLSMNHKNIFSIKHTANSKNLDMILQLHKTVQDFVNNALFCLSTAVQEPGWRLSSKDLEGFQLKHT